MNEEKKRNKPVKKFKAGSVSATIWKSKEEKTLLTVFEKSYKDKEGQWHNTNHFTVADLATISWLARQAFDYNTTNGR